MRIDALVTDDVDRLVQMLRLLADGNLAVGQLNVAAGAVDVAALDTYRTTYEGYARSLGEKRMMLVVAGVDSAALEQIGRAHVCTPVTNAPLVLRLLLEKKN